MMRTGDIERVGSERGHLRPEGLGLKRAQGASKASGYRERMGPTASENRGKGTVVSDRGGGQDVSILIGVGEEPLTRRLRRWKQIGSHEEQKGMWPADLERRGIWWVRKTVGRLWACG